MSNPSNQVSGQNPGAPGPDRRGLIRKIVLWWLLVVALFFLIAFTVGGLKP
jgi:hypothetical protein